MIRILAYRLQQRAFGSISAQNKGRLRQLAQAFHNRERALQAGAIAYLQKPVDDPVVVLSARDLRAREIPTRR
jgi:CheY-like chemotaxis protein